MKTARRLGLASAMALALMACIGVSSAAASSKIAVDEYPAYMVGELQGSAEWTVGGAQLGCSGGGFTAGIESAAKRDILRPSIADHSCLNGTVAMNGCTFVLHPHEQTAEGEYAGGVSVGNAPGKTCSSGITVALTAYRSSCTWTVGPQTRVQGVTFKEVEESPDEFEIVMDNVSFSSTRSCGSSTLVYAATWRVSAYQDVGGRAGSQIDTSIETDTNGTMFEAEEYQATVTGAANSTFKMSHVASVSCADTLLDGGLSSAGPWLDTNATYVDCTATLPTGAHSATVRMDGCHYGLELDFNDASSPYGGSVDLDCDQGAELQITIQTSATNSCVFHIGPQSGFEGSEFSTLGSGGGVFASLHAERMTATRTGAVVCGMVNQTATMDADAWLSGENGSGQPIGLWVN